MIIEYVVTMWADLFMAGYRPAPPKPTKETWVEYITRAKKEVKLYLEEKREEKNGRS